MPRRFTQRRSDATTYTGVWDVFRENTTAHGVAYCRRSKGKLRYAFWILALLFAWVVVLYNVTKQSHRYSMYEVHVEVIEDVKPDMTFPAITVCNMNPIKRSAWELYVQHAEPGPHADAESKEPSPNHTGGTETVSKRRRRRKRNVQCAEDWVPFGGKCYSNITKQAYSLDEALEFCTGMSSGLVTIQSQAEMDFLVDLANGLGASKFWLGLTLEWIWPDGNRTDYLGYDFSLWGPSPTGHRCMRLEMNDTAGKLMWYIADCAVRAQYICEKKRDLGCPAGWKGNGDSCYILPETAKTRVKAERECRVTHSSELVTIETSDENDFLQNITDPALQYWTGLFWDYLWLDGTCRTFSYWKDPDPDNMEGEDVCARANRGSFEWQDIECTRGKTYNVICKTPPTSEEICHPVLQTTHSTVDSSINTTVGETLGVQSTTTADTTSSSSTQPVSQGDTTISRSTKPTSEGDNTFSRPTQTISQEDFPVSSSTQTMSDEDTTISRPTQLTLQRSTVSLYPGQTTRAETSAELSSATPPRSVHPSHT